MECYLCDQDADQRCPRCGNPYCRDHGDGPSAGSGQALCADCLSPVSAAPSGTFFRVSLLALLLGSVLALWVLIRPPGLPGQSSEVIVPEASPMPSPGPVTPSPPIVPTAETPVADATAEPTLEPTPVPTSEPTPVPTEAPPQPIEYTVVDGDTWYGIAQFFGVDAESLAAYNGYTLEDVIQPGDVLVIPQ